MVQLGDLVPAPYNPRRMTPAEEKHLTESVRSFGLVDPLIVNGHPGRKNIVIGGHQRLRIARKLGLTAVPVVYVSLEEARERELNLRLNKNLGEWDFDLLAQFERGLLERVGFDEKELAKLFPAEVVEDEAPPLPDEPVTRPGDLYTLGEHRLLCGDATITNDVDRLMGHEKAEMIFTDPPYGVGYDGGTKARDRLAGDDSTDLYGPCCRMAMDHSVEDAPMYLWHAGIKGIAAAAAAAAAAAGWEIRCEIVWNKNQAQYGALSSHYKQKHEPAYYCFKRGAASRWCGPTTELTVWDIDRSRSNEYHPTQKPIALCARAIGNHDAGSVLDLFGGSGSTLIACEQLDRRCYMLEIDPRYCDVIVARWEKLTGRKADRARG